MNWEQYKIEVSKELQKQAAYTKEQADNYAECFDESFKESKLKFSGQVSAVAVTKGASADIAYEDGVAVYTMTKGGLMYEASMGGQKFKYLPGEEVEEVISETK